MIEIQFQFPAWLLNTHVNQSGNMTEADIVYSDVIFIKTKEKATGESLLNMFISLLLNDIPGTHFLYILKQ